MNKVKKEDHKETFYYCITNLRESLISLGFF